MNSPILQNVDSEIRSRKQNYSSKAEDCIGTYDQIQSSALGETIAHDNTLYERNQQTRVPARDRPKVDHQSLRARRVGAFEHPANERVDRFTAVTAHRTDPDVGRAVRSIDDVRIAWLRRGGRWRSRPR